MVFFRLLLVALVTLCGASQVTAQETAQGTVASQLDSMLETIETAEITPIRTESPRNTLQSLYQLRDVLETSLGAYWQQQNTSNEIQIVFVIGQIRALIDPVAAESFSAGDFLHFFVRLRILVCRALAGRSVADRIGAESYACFMILKDGCAVRRSP